MATAKLNDEDLATIIEEIKKRQSPVTIQELVDLLRARYTA